MKKISVIGATLVGAAVLCAAPISLHQSQDKGLSLSVDKARAVIGRPLTPGSVAGVHRRLIGVHIAVNIITRGPITLIATTATITVIATTTTITTIGTTVTITVIGMRATTTIIASTVVTIIAIGNTCRVLA